MSTKYRSSCDVPTSVIVARLYRLAGAVTGPVAHGVIAKHRYLLEELGLVRTVCLTGSLMMYSGGCIQATVELVEV